MRAIFESAFDILYLITIIALGFVYILSPKTRPQRRIFGLMALVLGFGDAFHLVPRVIGLLSGTMASIAPALGAGKLITSITMTVFYAMLYWFCLLRYKMPAKSPLTFIIAVLAAARIALCLFPQNEWLSSDPPLSWGIYRNIPFAAIGAIIAYIFYSNSKKAHDRPFRFAWLAVSFSFLFYIPVVLWADRIPAMGMLMIPKTICYVWLIAMGYKPSEGNHKQN